MSSVYDLPHGVLDEIRVIQSIATLLRTIYTAVSFRQLFSVTDLGYLYVTCHAHFLVVIMNTFIRQ